MFNLNVCFWFFIIIGTNQVNSVRWIKAAKSGMKCGDNVVGLWFNGTDMINFKWKKIVAAFHSAQSCKLELA